MLEPRFSCKFVKRILSWLLQFDPYQSGRWNIGPSADSYTPWLNSATDWVLLLLHYIQDTWPSGGIAVSEFGWTGPYEELKQLRQDILYDPGRMIYYHNYMEAVLISISEGVNVVGCQAWAIMDNLEWAGRLKSDFKDIYRLLYKTIIQHNTS
jgi:beta-glucosidase